MLLVLLSSLLGFICWGQSPDWWPLSVLMLFLPVLWFRSRSRLVAGLVVAAYGLAAARGIPEGAAQYFGTDIIHGSFWWLCAGMLWFFAGALFWFQSIKIRVLMVPVLLLALVVSPAGLVGWANPLTGAGWLFPSWGFWGVLAVIFLMIFLVKIVNVAMLITASIWLVIWSFSLALPVDKPPHWSALHTNNAAFEFGDRAGEIRDLIREYQNMIFLQSEAANVSGSIVFTPESVGGVWNKSAAEVWKKWSRRHVEKTVLLGATLATGKGAENVIMLIEKGKSSVLYRQRFPVPAVSWNPLNTEEYKSHMQSGLSNIAGQKVAFLVCYETLMVWPVLLSMIDGPDVLAVNGSVWWAGDSIKNAQRQAVKGWARLFDVALIEAWNT